MNVAEGKPQVRSSVQSTGHTVVAVVMRGRGSATLARDMSLLLQCEGILDALNTIFKESDAALADCHNAGQRPCARCPVCTR